MTTESILDQARRCGFFQGALRDLAVHLPGDDPALDRLLVEAVDRRDELAFTHLLLSALDAGRTVDARHLVEGGALLPDLGILASAAIHCSGDVAEALVEAVRRGRMGWERESAALLLGGWWAKEHCGGEVPRGLLAQARTLARKTVGHYVAQVILLALSDLVGDDGLGALLKPLDLPEIREVAREIREGLIDRSCDSVFAHVPDRPRPNVLSGYTVRRAVPRIGRNEPCPCGSGKKYKRCCYEKDQERLRHSSDVAGVTIEELRASPEDHLDARRLGEMRSYELARLDPTKVAPELHPVLLNWLITYGEFEAVLAFFRNVGYREELDGHLLDAVEFATEASEAAVVRELLDLRGERSSEDLGPGLGALLLASREEPGPVLAKIEEEALKLLDREGALRLVDFAHGLLSSPFPGLGILVARGVLPLASYLDGHVLLDRLLETRDRLDLSPDDPIEEAVDFFLPPSWPEEEDEDRALTEAHQALDRKNSEVRQLREEVAALRRKLDRSEERSPLQAPTLKRAAGEPTPAQGPSAAELRQRLGSLKNDLKQRHMERNQLRRELLKAREDLETLRRGQSEEVDAGGVDAEAREAREDTFLLPEETLGAQPVRIPVFPPKFSESLAACPESVARGAVRLVGGLAAGDLAAFLGAKRLKVNREVWRQRVGPAYRLLFRLHPDNLEVVTLVSRQDLERTIKSVGRT